MRKRTGRGLLWAGVTAAVVLAVGAGGFAAYKRFGGYHQACLLPAVSGNGAGISTGSADSPLRVVDGNTALLQRAENPVKFTKTTSRVELRGVYYDGALFGDYTVPRVGGLRTLRIAGQPVPLRDGTIDGGCVDTKSLGHVIVLFSGAQSVTATVLLTQEQIDLLR